MNINQGRRFRVLLLGFCLLSGCVSRQIDPATLAPDDLYSRAAAAYEARDYGEAIPFLDAFIQHHLGDPRAPQALMMMGRAHMARREYVTASTYLQRLVTDFPSSPLNLEARFATCESYVLLSPRPQLDQEYTRAALDHCESIATNFPGTTEAQRAGAYVVEMREKLAEKVYLSGVFYQRRRAFDSAIIYFTDVVDDYPQTTFAPAALGRLVEVYSQLGYVEEAQETRERLQRDYPNSPAAQALPAGTASAAR